MGNIEKNKKDQLAVISGFVLILAVFAITLIRNDFSKDKKREAKYGSTLSTKTNEKNKYPTISTQDLSSKILTEKENFILLDIRPFDSYIEEHIVDSVQISLDEFPVGEKLDKHKQIVVIGQDSGDTQIQEAVEKLKKEDFDKVIALAGGIEKWKEMLGTTVTYGNPKSFVDQSKVSYLDPEELQTAIESEAPLYIIDIRSDSEYKKGHIKGAINIPFDEIEKRRSEVTERKAIIVGSNELEEFQAGVQLYDMLLISPFVMRTAMPGWENKGFPLTQ